MNRVAGIVFMIAGIAFWVLGTEKEIDAMSLVGACVFVVGICITFSRTTKGSKS